MIFIILFGILALGLLILVHEIGHFIAAKLSHVRVFEMTIGFGPAIFKYRRGETLYAVRLIPLGGAVIMESAEEDGGEPSAGSFQNASISHRLFITVAGPIMNLVLGLLILFILFLPVQAYITPQISSFMDGFLFEGPEGFMPGDKIEKINGSRILLYEDLMSELISGEGRPFDFELRRGGEKILLKDIPLTRREYVEEGKTSLYYGFRFTPKEAGLADKLSLAAFNGYNFVRMVFKSLEMMFSGEVGVKDMSGPVAITTAISDAAERSPMQAWYFVAFISINLGIVNLLPIPALDGGRLLLIIYERIRGRPVNPRYEGYIQMAGLFLLLGLFVVITFNDIMRIFGG